MMDSKMHMVLLAWLICPLVIWLCRRWSAWLSHDGVIAYGCQGQRPQMRWAHSWFVLWFNGCVMALMALCSEPPLALVVWVVWLAVLGLLGLIDAHTGLLPNELTLVVMLGGLAWQSIEAGVWLPPPSFAWGMVLGWLLPWTLNRLHERWRGIQAIGEGDAKLFAGIGSWLGWQALPMVWVIACLAVLVYTALLWIAGHQRPAYVAFGPFLVVGASLVMLLNHV